ncbi:NAD(P)-dependent oxidoreductase [Pedobacter sp. KR3-3]|uniref:NAD(P)-dependent oxidoreductase n=1 Tax=Pedobacter albus TaxID=3113905 RepID=A0ABU7I3U1_9SPHI|nr:NAD(P)-dependent oxidoreductase [Pedobacter sp. KR3-3]MEE1943991.1 NAD(P)-dependent oxidoreductase [Pedobacter sp. KR3-3]
MPNFVAFQPFNTTKMEQTQIGWIGLGKMGIPMAGNLIKAGYPVSVYNRNQAKADALLQEGAAWVDSPAELIQKTAVVFLMVSDDVAVNEIFNAENGLLSNNLSGKIIVNMSTVSPQISKEMAELCQQKGASYLDAPVSGSVKQAQEGSLVIMVGGEEEPTEQVRPLFDVLGKMALRLGPTGAGNAAKLAINSLLALYALGLAETVVFARNQGVQVADLLQLLNNGALSNVFTKIKGDAILQDNYEAAFALKHIVKDLGLAKKEGLQSPLAQTAFATFEAANNQLAEEDIIAVIKTLD